MEFLFEVQLIRVPPIEQLTGPQVFLLMINARHVAGDYWIFEGDIDTFPFHVLIVETSTTEGFGDMNDRELIEHCHDIFGMDFNDENPSYKMINQFIEHGYL